MTPDSPVGTPGEAAVLLRCGPAVASAVPSGGARHPAIDMHCHVLCSAVEDLLADDPRRQADRGAMLRAQGLASARQSGAMMADILLKLTHLADRLADMDRMGVDMQVLSPAPNQYYYWAEDALAEKIVWMQNEHIAQLCALHPDRLVGLGTLALQNPALALRQIDHAVGVLGLRGVEVSTMVNGVSIADAHFDPVWARAEALGCMVLLHPLGSDQGERLNRHYLWNVIGQPFETTVALSELILSGLFERHPATRLCACHGGGFLPAYWGRLDHAWRVRPEARTTPRAPSSYLRQLYYDTVVYDPAQLRQLIEKVGSTQVVMGTDYPYDMGHYEPHALVEAIAGLDDAQRAALLAGNARRLLGLTETVE